MTEALRNQHKRPQQGSAMLTAVAMVVVFTLVGYSIVRLVSNHSHAGSTQDEMQEVEMIRQTILNYTDCRKTTGLGYNDTYAKCKKDKYTIKDRTGQPLFPLSGSSTHIISTQFPDGVIRAQWEISATCEDDQLKLERRALGKRSSSFLSGWVPLWPESQDPGLCRAYFSNNHHCMGDYPVLAGTGPDDGELCCRMVENQFGVSCHDTEYLVMGGAACAPPDKTDDVLQAAVSAERCYADADAMLYKDIANGTARGITLTNPSLPGLHTDPIIPAIMEARATYPKTKNYRKTEWPHGGFLIQNGYASMHGANVIDSWVAACKVDDWEQGFATTVRGYCCPKKPPSK